jgi:polyhydroxyalkanoate synthase
MTLADEPKNPKPAKKLNQSLDAITALREAMEKRLREAQEYHAAHATIAETTAPPPESLDKAEKHTVTDPEQVTYDPAEWSRILYHIAERSRTLFLDYLARNKPTELTLPTYDPGHFADAFAELGAKLLNDPQRLVEAQINLWQGYAQIWQTTLARMQGEKVDDIVKPAPSDKRFQDKEWQSNWLFDLLKQIYLLTTQQMKTTVQKEAETLNPKLARKIEFATRQMTDAISPSNFWLTNPEVLRMVYQTGGESLLKGFENLLNDLEKGKGDLRIRMTDINAFNLGGNLATTPGKVVYQNPLMQLIQYAPATPEANQVPLLIIPPWINKFYILDLRQKNSFIAYLVAQGFTVFCISWVNPDERHAKIDFDDYMAEGALSAMREIKHITTENEVNCVGYCIGGTLLASTLAYLKTLPDYPPALPQVSSATYLVTMTDFSEPGDLGNFLDEDLIRYAEERMAKQGYLDAASMANVFNLLRSNDLIWSYVVNNYLLGKDPTPFDILYWNSDSTNMPEAMQRYYIHEMYIKNNLVKPCALAMKHRKIDLRQITTPTYMLSTREDHIAPWKSTYAATQIYGGPITFTLAASGHIAGIVNPPANNKYGYWTNNACPASPEDWLKKATEHKGSWWPEWIKWLQPYSGEPIPAREIKNGIEDAPGSYVKVRVV